jgi:cyclopropane-fatty-acyl-phospholipid synthase
MCYSSAMFEPDDDLARAQLRKIDYHLAEARAAGAARVLDVGCGWGQLLRRAVEAHRVAHIVGVTPSLNQAKHIRDFGDPRIEVEVGSWYDHRPAMPYDAIVSIGAFEHFARRGALQGEKLEGYRAFFGEVHSWLKQDGVFSLQTIAYGNMRREDQNNFLSSQIFPESDLPTLADLVLSSDGLFEVVRLRNDRSDYERTLIEWTKNLRRSWQHAVALVGLERVKMFDRYLRLSALGFHTGTANLFRVTLRRIDRSRA